MKQPLLQGAARSTSPFARSRVHSRSRDFISVFYGEHAARVRNVFTRSKVWPWNYLDAHEAMSCSGPANFWAFDSDYGAYRLVMI
jgi:hypothetical protein